MEGKCKCGWSHTLVTVLAVIGALNWGLVGAGLFAGKNWNLVNQLLGSWPTVEAVVYLVVGLAGLWLLVSLFTSCKCKE